MKDEEARLNTGLGFVGWFLGIDAFLLGILIANYATFGERFRIPILFLVLSLVGFIQSARFYRDASGASVYGAKIGLTSNKMHELGNIISEQIGVNMLLASIPLIVALLIDDKFITITTALTIGLVFAWYMITEYTIIARRYMPPYRVVYAFLYSVPLILAATFSRGNLLYLSFITMGISLLTCLHSMIFLKYKTI